MSDRRPETITQPREAVLAGVLGSTGIDGDEMYHDHPRGDAVSTYW